MQTRRFFPCPRTNLCYDKNIATVKKRKLYIDAITGVPPVISRKRPKVPALSVANTGGFSLFDSLPDDLVVLILGKLSSTAGSPSHFINVFLTCKRLKELAHQKLVLSKANSNTFSVPAKNWSEFAYRFFKRCVHAGNDEACYILGMIQFYCMQNRAAGASLIAKAAIGSHAPALYSLAVIQFNGSGGQKNHKDLRAGVALCLRAAFRGHIDALRELGYCLQDGYGVLQNIVLGRRFIVEACARELASVLSSNARALHRRHGLITGCSLWSDFGRAIPVQDAHPVNRFLSEWFNARGGGPGYGLRMCSRIGCGRPETRRHEFRRCSVCGGVNYCSRSCQSLDWTLQHKVECAPVERRPGDELHDDGDDVHGGNNEDVNDDNVDVMF